MIEKLYYSIKRIILSSNAQPNICLHYTEVSRAMVVQRDVWDDDSSDLFYRIWRAKNSVTHGFFSLGMGSYYRGARESKNEIPNVRYMEYNLEKRSEQMNGNVVQGDTGCPDKFLIMFIADTDIKKGDELTVSLQVDSKTGQVGFKSTHYKLDQTNA